MEENVNADADSALVDVERLVSSGIRNITASGKSLERRIACERASIRMVRSSECTVPCHAFSVNCVIKIIEEFQSSETAIITDEAALLAWTRNSAEQLTKCSSLNVHEVNKSRASTKASTTKSVTSFKAIYGRAPRFAVDAM